MTVYDAAQDTGKPTIPISTIRHLLWLEGDHNLGVDGGHFIAGLVYTIRHADNENRLKLRNEYPDLVDGVLVLMRERWAFGWFRALVKAHLDRTEFGLDLIGAAS